MNNDLLPIFSLILFAISLLVGLSAILVWRQLRAMKVRLEQLKEKMLAPIPPAPNNRMLARIAHDLSSPLSVFNIVANSKEGIDPERAELLRRGCERINKIIAELLDRSEAPVKIFSVLRNLIDEKRAQYDQRVDLRYSFSDEAQTCLVRASSMELIDTIAKFIDKSVASGERALVTVNGQIDQSALVLSLRDFGHAAVTQLRCPLVVLEREAVARRGPHKLKS